MPRTPRCHGVDAGCVVEDEGGGEAFFGGRHGFEAGFDFAEGFGFGGAAVVVEPVEFFGEGAGKGGVAGEKHFDDVGGDVHAAGGVDARSDAEADVEGGDGAGEVDVGELHEGAEAGLRGLAELVEAKRGDGAVFAGERDGVGDRGDGEELEEAGEELFADAGEFFGRCTAGAVGCGRLKDGLCELEGDGGSAELFVGIGAAGLVGVEDGEGLGDAGAGVGKVVVGDDEVEAEAGGFFGGGEGADAGVDGDDELDAFSRGVGEAGGLDAVAFAEAMGDVVADVGGDVEVDGGAFEGGLEQDRGDGAVDVVVAVDEDGLLREEGGAEALDGGAHSEHEVGGVELGEVGMEEGAGGFRGGEVAAGEDGGDGFGEA